MVQHVLADKRRS